MGHCKLPHKDGKNNKQHNENACFTWQIPPASGDGLSPGHEPRTQAPVGGSARKEFHRCEKVE